MFADNDYYGHRYILSKYCKIRNTNCFASIQHGILSPPQEKNLGKRKFIFAPFLTWNKRVEKNAKRKKIPRVISIGSSFLYLDKIKKKNFNKPSGTLVFPSKSTWNKSRSVNNEALIKETEKNFKGPYSICIYYLDLDKDWEIFKKRGWKVFSCGNKKSKKFLFILYDKIAKHKNVICTSINTAAFYAMYMQKNFKLIFKSSFKKKNKFLVEFENSEDVSIQKKTRKFFEKKYPGFVKNRLSKKKRLYIAKEELGFYSMKSKKEIIKILGWDNFIKRFLAKLLKFYFIFRIV